MVNISICARWKQNGTIIAGGLRGSSLTELNSPYGIFVDINQDNTLYVADSGNERVIKFKQDESNGDIVVENMKYLRSVIMHEEQNLYIIDEVEIFKFAPDYDARVRIAGENSQYSGLSRIQEPFEIVLDEKKNLYISDAYNHRVFMWKPNAKEGILIAGTSFQAGFDPLHLFKPQGIFLDTFYNALYVNHRIQRFHPIGNFTGETVAGINQSGASLYQLKYPSSIYVLNNRDIFITDSHNKRIVRWTLGNYTAGGSCIIGCTDQAEALQNVLQHPINYQI